MKHIKVNSNLIFLKKNSGTVTYNIVVEAVPKAYGITEGSGTYKAGTTVTIKAIPNEGYDFSHWDDGNTSTERLVIVNESKTYTATFVGSKVTTISTSKRGQNNLYYFFIPQTNFQHLGEIEVQCVKFNGMDTIYEVAQFYINPDAEEGKEWAYTGGNFIKKNLVTWDESSNILKINDAEGIGMNPFIMLPGVKTLTYIGIATKSPNLLTATDTATLKLP